MTKQEFVKPKLRILTGGYNARTASEAVNTTPDDDLYNKWWFRIKAYNNCIVEVCNASDASTIYWVKACLEEDSTSSGLPSKDWHNLTASSILGANTCSYFHVEYEPWDFLAIGVSGGRGTVKIKLSSL